LKLVIVAVGKLKERAYRELGDEYLARIRRYTRCEEIEVADAEALARRAPGDAFVIALEVDGKTRTSEGFARELGDLFARDKGVVAFLIGGAEGIPDELSRRANLRLSLSTFTLPHRLARIVLYEQLYRALSILRGEPYAREG
jgi:23S rRNA (pseudouridine1915-N3)-methyltransferase